MDDLDKIFRAYDVRGVYPNEINEKIAHKIGKISAQILDINLKNGKMTIARDGRRSSSKLLKAIEKGINEAGIDIVNIGLTTTPMFYFAVNKFKADGGIMVTASHNSEKYNGFKIVSKNAMPIGSIGLNKIKKIIEINYDSGATKKKGKTVKKEIFNDYIKKILGLSRVSKTSQFKIAVNKKNKTAKSVVLRIVKNIKKIKLVDSSLKADFGITFDGDGDRIFFTDENNKKIDPDIISAILIHYCFKRANTILYTVASSRIVKEEAINNGSEIACSKIGHSFIKEIMARKNIDFGCEASGHYYFKEAGYCEEPILVLTKIMQALSMAKMSLSKLVKSFDKLYRERIEIKINSINKVNLQIKKIENKYKKISRSGRLPNILHIDGLSVEYPDWWFNLHVSNTEPLVRLTIEADTKQLLLEQKEKLLKLINII
jgi:phosphomannomutase